jgi:hypothetical protein
MPAIFQDNAKPGPLRAFARHLGTAVGIFGLLSSPFTILLAICANLDPRTPAQGLLLSVSCLCFPCLSLAGCAARRPWLGPIGLAIMVGGINASMDAGEFTEADRDAYRAVESGDAALLRKQLAAGVDPDLHTYDRGYLLKAAIYSPNPELVGILIDAGADINAHNGDHATPLVMAVHMSRCDAALALARAGASFAERFYVDGELAEAPTYHGMNVVEMYYAQARKDARTWKQHEACWRQFETVLEQKKEAMASFRCDTAWSGTRRKLYQVFGKVTPC